MLRLITCHTATLLLEKRADDALLPRERRSLWLHLRVCPLCNRYAHQTVLIAELARAAAAPRTGRALSGAARQRLAALLPAA